MEKEKREERERKSRELQQVFFGRRFEGATLSRIPLEEKASKNLSSWLSCPKDFLVVFGKPGTGKTYLCSAIVDALFDREQSLRCYNEHTLFRNIRKMISSDARGDYIEYLQNALDDSLVILDDFGAAGHNEWREEVWMEAVDFRYRNNMATVITSNLTPQEAYKIYGDRIANRVFATSNLIIDYSGMPDMRLKGY